MVKVLLRGINRREGVEGIQALVRGEEKYRRQQEL